MNFQERKRMILELLDKKSSWDVPELSKKLKVSEITVRRDLNALSEKGLIFRTHGGAMNLRLAKDPVDFRNKTATNTEQKDHIAQIASMLVEDGDIIFLDCGSTVYGMNPYIKHKSIKVVTNSLPLANALLQTNVSVNLVGGELDHERMAVHGKMAMEHISKYKATKAFLGVDGISLKEGLTANSEKEAQITLSMAANSARVFLLCDSSKLEKVKYLQFGSLKMAQTLITDTEAPEELLKKYRKAGIEVINRYKK